MLNGDLVLVKVPAAILPHYIQLGVRVLGKELFSLLDDVLVVGPCKALVRRDDQTPISALQRRVIVRRIEIGTVYIPCRAEDPLDLAPQGVKIRPGVGQIVPCLPQLGGGNEVHGVGDLHGIFNAFHTLLNFLRIRHN